MTSQTKKFIETSDLLALRFECKCSLTVVIPISKYKEMPITCPNCGHEFAEHVNTSVQQVFSGLIAALERAQQTAQARGFKFSLEVRDDAK